MFVQRMLNRFADNNLLKNNYKNSCKYTLRNMYMINFKDCLYNIYK